MMGKQGQLRMQFTVFAQISNQLMIIRHGNVSCNVTRPQTTLTIITQASRLLHSIKNHMIKHVLPKVDNSHIVFAREP